MDELTRFAQRARRGDQQALEALARDCYPDVWRLCAALVDADAADDLSQETLARIVRAIRSFRGESSARTWVLAIARRTCMDELRSRARQSRREHTLMTHLPELSAEASFPVEIRDLLAGLDPERRAAFALTQLLRLSYQEAAEVCDCPTGTIRSRVARAREDLIKLLDEQPATASVQTPGCPPGTRPDSL